MRRIKLVLLPGLDGTGLLFEPLLRALPADIEPIVAAYPQDEALSVDELLPRIAQLLPKDEVFAILGESFGGPLALRLAAMQPAGLRAIVLSASFVQCPQAWAPRSSARLARPWLFKSFPLFARIKAAVGGYPTPELAALSGRVLSSVAPQVLAQRMRDVIGMDVCDSFARCALPVLYLRGTADRIVPAANQRQLAQIKADMETVTLPCGHMILQDQPERAAAAIHAFLLRHIDAAQSVNDMGGAGDSDATRQGDSQHA